MKKIIIHPFIFALYPPLALLSVNIDHISGYQFILPIVGYLLVATIVFLLLARVLKNSHQAALLVSVGIISLTVYTHTEQWMQNIAKIDGKLILFSRLMVIGIVVLAVGLFIFFAIKHILLASKFLNVVAIALILMPTVKIIWQLMQNAKVQEYASMEVNMENLETTEPLPGAEVLGQDAVKPDIYFIVMDGYAREDVISTLYNLDTSGFIKALEKQGFYVPAESHSNYNQTAFSLASTLNMRYLDAEAQAMGAESTKRKPLIDLINNSSLGRILKTNGYVTVAIKSNYEYTDIVDSDYFLDPLAKKGPNFFEWELLNELGAASLVANDMAQQYRNRTIGTFSLLNDLNDIPSPKFVIAHIILPHPPFVFDENGLPQLPEMFNLSDGSHFSGSHDEYITGYRAQVQFANKLILGTLETVLDKQTNKPVIFIEGDHGSGLYLDWNSKDDSCIWERMSNFMAIFLPNGGETQLYSAITPVNVFRQILDEYLGTHFGQIEDRTYFSLWDTPYQLYDVTGGTDSCQPLSK